MDKAKSETFKELLQERLSKKFIARDLYENTEKSQIRLNQIKHLFDLCNQFKNDTDKFFDKIITIKQFLSILKSLNTMRTVSSLWLHIKDKNYEGIDTKKLIELGLVSGLNEFVEKCESMKFRINNAYSDWDTFIEDAWKNDSFQMTGKINAYLETFSHKKTTSIWENILLEEFEQLSDFLTMLWQLNIFKKHNFYQLPDFFQLGMKLDYSNIERDIIGVTVNHKMFSEQRGKLLRLIESGKGKLN